MKRSGIVLIMCTAIRKILYLPKFFAFFFESHDYPLFCPNFLPFLAPKLDSLIREKIRPVAKFEGNP